MVSNAALPLPDDMFGLAEILPSSVRTGTERLLDALAETWSGEDTRRRGLCSQSLALVGASARRHPLHPNTQNGLSVPDGDPLLFSSRQRAFGEWREVHAQ